MSCKGLSLAYQLRQVFQEKTHHLQGKQKSQERALTSNKIQRTMFYDIRQINSLIELPQKPISSVNTVYCRVYAIIVRLFINLQDHLALLTTLTRRRSFFAFKYF